MHAFNITIYIKKITGIHTKHRFKLINILIIKLTKLKLK